MIVTAKLRYALNLLVILGRHDPAQPLPLREIADGVDASDKYLEAVVAELRRSGIVVSKKGKAGGYVLARPPRDISLLQIVDACEPELLTGPLPRGGDNAALWAEVVDRFENIFAEYRLSDLVNGRFSQGQVLNYVI